MLAAAVAAVQLRLVLVVLVVAVRELWVELRVLAQQTQEVVAVAREIMLVHQAVEVQQNLLLPY
jgi:hypothetical protein